MSLLLFIGAVLLMIDQGNTKGMNTSVWALFSIADALWVIAIAGLF